jgi:hypothetical protein
MGHWSTYRKRGRVPVSPTLIPAPPAPVLTLTEEVLIIEASGGNDEGGYHHLQVSEDGGDTWTERSELDWQAVREIDVEDLFPDTRFRCVETGNGVAYLGDSPPSNVVVMP